MSQTIQTKKNPVTETPLFRYFLKVQASWGHYKQTQRGQLKSFANWKQYITFNYGENALAELTQKATVEVKA